MTEPQLTDSQEAKEAWRRGLAHQAEQPSLLSAFTPEELSRLMSHFFCVRDEDEPAPDHPNRNQ